MRYLEGFQNLAKQESAQVQDTEEGFWFGSGPKAGAVPGSEITCIGVSVEVAEFADLLCFDTLGGGQYRSLYQKVVVEKTCELGLIEIALLLPPAQIGDRWEWAQVSIYDDDGVGGLPLTLLGRCVPVPLQTLTNLNITTLILPVWVPFAVTAGDVIWVAISGKAYNDPPYAWNYSTNTHCLALGDRTTVGTDLIKAEDEEPPFTTAPPVDIPDVHVWVRIYSDPLSADYPVTDTAPLSVHPAGARAIIARPVRGQVESSYVQGIRPRYASVPYSQTIYGTGVGGGVGNVVPEHNLLLSIQGGSATERYHFTLAEYDALTDNQPFGASRVIYADADGHLKGDARFIWDDANDYLGLFGSGAVNIAPLYPLHIERSASADQVLAYFRNTSADDNVSAAVVVENSSVGHAGVLAQFGVTYSRVPSFADKTALFSLENSKGLVFLPITGMTEFWLYHGAYPADAYQHVADIRSTAANVGFMPGADSAFVLGSETGPLRWADGSFDQLHVNSYLLSMSGALTVESASLVNQDLTTDSEPLFAALQLGSVLANLRGTSADGTDNQRLDIVPHGGGGYSFGRGAGIAMWGNEGTANYKGAMLLGSGQPGTTGTYDGMVLLYANGALAAMWNRSQQFLLPDGTAAAPTLSFINEATLGLRRVSAGLLGVSGGFVGEYQTQSGAWADPSGTGVNGRIVTVYNSSTAPNHRVYIYSNGAWHYLNADA